MPNYLARRQHREWPGHHAQAGEYLQLNHAKEYLAAADLLRFDKYSFENAVTNYQNSDHV